jgi:hypothetical protein
MPTCSDLITSAGLLDYIPNLGFFAQPPKYAVHGIFGDMQSLGICGVREEGAEGDTSIGSK